MEVPPESSDMREREGTVREQGIVNGNVLLLISQKGRLDWNVLPGPEPSSDRSSPPALVGAEQVIPLLRRALGVSMHASGLVDRIALGSVLTQQASSVSEGLRQLSKYLPRLDLENEGGSDFVYQINKPRRSFHALQVQINRLSRWQLEEVVGGVLAVGPSGPPRFETSGRVLVSKLALDINTSPNNNAFSSARAPDLFDELADFAHEIANKGDVK